MEYLAGTIGAIPDLEDDVLVDDRTHLTIGKRVLDARKVGYPIQVVVGKRASEPMPVFEVNNVNSGTSDHLTHHQLIKYLRNMNFDANR